MSLVVAIDSLLKLSKAVIGFGEDFLPNLGFGYGTTTATTKDIMLSITE